MVLQSGKGGKFDVPILIQYSVHLSYVGSSRRFDMKANHTSVMVALTIKPLRIVFTVLPCLFHLQSPMNAEMRHICWPRIYSSSHSSSMPTPAKNLRHQSKLLFYFWIEEGASPASWSTNS